MVSFSGGKKTNTEFIIKNQSVQRRTIKVFNYKIPYLGTLDLLAIPGITEEDIRASLLKGILKDRITAGELAIVKSDINLLQFSSEQKAFLEKHGLTVGVAIKEADGLKVNDTSKLLELYGRIKGGLSLLEAENHSIQVDSTLNFLSNGGSLSFKAGDGRIATSNSDGYAGGTLSFTGGGGGPGLSVTAGGAGGQVTISGGAGGNDNGADGGVGGNVLLLGGQGKGTSDGGNLVLRGGAAIDTGSDGKVQVGLTSTSSVEIGAPLRPIGISIQASFVVDSGEVIAAGSPVGIEDPTGDGYGPLAYLADANAVGTRHFICGLAAEDAAGDGYGDVIIVTSGEVPVSDNLWDSVPAAVDCGKIVWLSETAGKLTLTKPTTSGSYAHIVGLLTRGGTGACKVSVSIKLSDTANV